MSLAAWGIIILSCLVLLSVISLCFYITFHTHFRPSEVE